MSPASQGALEVERYIGSCLISSTGRPGLQKPLGGCRKQEQQQQAAGGLRTSKQCQSQFGAVGTWAGGAPLISMASNPRRNNQRSSAPPGQQNQSQQQQQQSQINHQAIGEQQLPAHLHNRVPLSRLAVHTQGAPLILSSSRFHNNRAKIHNGQAANAIANCVNGLLNGCANGTVNTNISNVPSNGMRCNPPPRLNKSMALEVKKGQQQSQNPNVKFDIKDVSTAHTTTTAPGTANVANIDSLSIASDESSGSNNSENSLPRIIKPRKRRKKDRKPPVVSVINPVNTSSTNDTKVAAEELQQTSLGISPLLQNGLSEQQQQQNQQPQQQQLKPFSGNSYDSTKYLGDGYFKGHRRLINNARESIYGRLHLTNGNNCTGNTCNSNVSPVSSNSTHQEVVDTRQQQQQQSQQRNVGYPAHRHLQVKVLDDNRNVILPIPVCQAKAAAGYLRHNGINNNAGATHSDARFLHDYNEPVTLTCHRAEDAGNIDDCLTGSLCQCHYCDPATLLWDVGEQNAYAPQFLAPASSTGDFGGVHHHHHHHHRYSQVPTTVFLTTARSFICPEHANAIEFFDVADNSCLRLRSTAAQTGERNDGAAILRRSWSDPTSYFSDEIVTPNRDVGVIGDRGQSGESIKGKSCWRGDASTAPSSSPTNQPSSPSSGSGSGAGSPNLQGPLEVSTEIVTSPNGHRDLEIKFYSSSPTSYAACPEEVKSAFAFPEDDNTNDSEEFSDIWSYHESKLQQDFRTLLQAEE